MASLADLQGVFSQAPPSQFSLASTGLAADMTKRQAKRQGTRTASDFTSRFIPDLLSEQGARGAFATSATREKVGRSVTDVGRSLSDLAEQSGQAQSIAAANALLAATGIQI